MKQRALTTILVSILVTLGFFFQARAQTEDLDDLRKKELTFLFISCRQKTSFVVAPFDCPENNGFFPDPEQCDLYYECIEGVPEAKLCPDGLLFEDGNPNQEKCDYPFNVECGVREYVRKSCKLIQFSCDYSFRTFFIDFFNL